jgi:hypothetical protein
MTPLLILDRLEEDEHGQIVTAKDWPKLLPPEFFDRQRNFKPELTDASELNGDLVGAITKQGWLLTLIHLSWYKEHPRSEASLQALIDGLKPENIQLFLIFVSDGRIDLDDRKELADALAGYQELHWIASRLDVPSRTRDPRPGLAKHFKGELINKLGEVAAEATFVERQRKFCQVVEQFEGTVDGILIDAKAAPSAREPMERALAPRDHAFRLFLLAKLCRAVDPAVKGEGLSQIEKEALESFPGELLAVEGIGRQTLEVWRHENIELVSVPEASFQALLAELAELAECD